MVQIREKKDVSRCVRQMSGCDILHEAVEMISLIHLVSQIRWVVLTLTSEAKGGGSSNRALYSEWIYECFHGGASFGRELMVVTMPFIKAGKKAWTMLFGTNNNNHILSGEEGGC